MTTDSSISYWQASCDYREPAYANIDHDIDCEIAIVGGGYTGLSAALHLARDFHADVVLLEAEQPGWGASGRNGGFCCMGSSKLSWVEIVKYYGKDAAREYFASQRASVELVKELSEREGIDVLAGEQGEVQLIHNMSLVESLHEESDFMRREFGHQLTLLDKSDLHERGLGSNYFCAGLLGEHAFGVHPLNYARGLAAAAGRHGVRIFGNTRVNALEKGGGKYILLTRGACISAAKVIVATNGYTDERLTTSLRGCTMPVQSNIIATRPMTRSELNTQGWTATTICFDSLKLLHYFRLMPDGTFVFGGRGGLSNSESTAVALCSRLKKEFVQYFPSWSHVDIDYYWRGNICLSYDLLPHIFQVENDDVYYGMAYHGNGVAMATWAGRALAGLAMGSRDEQYRVPAILARPLKRFPLAFLRSLYYRGVYTGYYFKDMLGKH